MMQSDANFLDTFLDPDGLAVELKLQGAGSSTCGQWGTLASPTNGAPMRFMMRCRLLTCEPCRGERVREERSRLARARRAGSDVRFARVNGQWESIAKRLKRRGITWRRFPQNGGEAVVVVDGDDKHLCLEALPDNLDLWLDGLLLDVPQGGRISGGLGKKPVDREEQGNGAGEKVTVRLRPIISTLTRADRERAEQDAVKATAYLDPKTATELQAALDCRQQAFMDAYAEVGGDGCCWYLPTQRRNVRLSHIDWRAYVTKRTSAAPDPGCADLRTDDEEPF